MLKRLLAGIIVALAGYRDLVSFSLAYCRIYTVGGYDLFING